MYEIVHYGHEPAQFGELWAPGPDAPVVVLVHGGYWRARYGLDLMHAMSADLAGRGYAVWNVEYRRVGEPGGGWPGTFEDVAAALDHLAVLARDRPLDLTRLAVVGHSAGGHLALWLAARRALAGAVLPTVAVSMAGVCDLAEAYRLGLSDGAVRELIGGGPDERPEVYALACPTRLAPLGVPQIVVHGTRDAAVPFALSARYAAVAGPGCRLVELPGVAHFEYLDPGSAAWATVAAELARCLA
ncbi:MAG TPA: alpha/beta hydrolase [Rugosimonospora sp.]|nr:alpha/beta hydrolase [Rugosimonospora sp.]